MNKISTNTESIYTYDALGHLTHTTDSAGNTLAFTYDQLGRLTSENNSGALVGYEYDANGNRTKLIYPNSKESTYIYDALNRIIDIRHPELISGSSVFGLVFWV